MNYHYHVMDVCDTDYGKAKVIFVSRVHKISVLYLDVSLKFHCHYITF